MPQHSPDFWNLDLTKLTWSGWLVILASCATVIGVGIAGIWVLEVLGLRHDPINNRNNRGLALLAFAPALAAGCAVFLLGRLFFARLGWPILRPKPVTRSPRRRSGKG
jgi:hypothetical protein